MRLPGAKTGIRFKSLHGCDGCVTTNPKFADYGKGDFTLRPSSPCKDTALLEPWMANAFDIAGNARVLDGGPNMGCYEFVLIKGMVILVR